MIPEGWREAKIRDVAKIDVGRDLVEERFARKMSDTHRFPIYSNTVEQHGHYGFYDFPEYSAESVTVVGRGIGLGTAFARTTPFGAIGRLLVLSPKDQSFDVSYLADYLNHGFQIHYESGGIPQLPGKTLGNYSILLPPLPEQRRIAEILATWDRAIETVEVLIANARAQKKALMQSLLTGKHRLPGFSGAWTEKPLDALFHFLKGQGLSKDSVTKEGAFPCILYGELYTRYPEVIGDVVGRTNANDGALSRAGDVLIPASTTTTGIDLANATALLQSDVRLSGDINILRSKDAKQSAPFFAYLLTHIKKLEIASRAQGSTIVHLYGSALKPLLVRIPEPDEQHAIGAIVMDADKQISELKSQLTALRQEKSALMQQLLTGKRRVKLDLEGAVC
jgi:restriction endonuclease S subunit